MEVRKINKNELGLFTSLDDDKQKFKNTVKNLWEKGLSYSKWCFVIINNDIVIGSVGYWSHNEESKILRLFGLSFPWQSNDLLYIGKKLLKESF